MAWSRQARKGARHDTSAAQNWILDPEFDKDPFEANLRAIKSEFDKARKISKDGIIGFNIMVAMQHYEEYVRAAVKEGTDFLVCGAGLPVDLPKMLLRQWKRWINLWRHQRLHQSFQLKNQRV